MAKTKDIKTIEVNGKTYAVGLFWQPVQNEKDFIKEVQRETSGKTIEEIKMFLK